MPSLIEIITYMLRWFWRLIVLVVFCVIVAVLLGVVLRPFMGFYQLQQAYQFGHIEQDWQPLEKIPLSMQRAAIAAEDADFCAHAGIDLAALQQALADGATRGASTITMQVAKNVYLWNARSYLRKGLELPIALLIDATWSKARILEVYLNVAEFDRQIFGVGAASTHYFGHSVEQLSPAQGAGLAAVLPDPKNRSANAPSHGLKRRGDKIMDGAATIASDGRDDCI